MLSKETKQCTTLSTTILTIIRICITINNSFHSIDMKDGLEVIADCILTQFLPLLHIEILHSQFDLIFNFIARSLVNGNSIHYLIYNT